MTKKRCHICGKEVRENYYLDKRGYTCYTCSKAIVSKRNIIKKHNGVDGMSNEEIISENLQVMEQTEKLQKAIIIIYICTFVANVVLILLKVGVIR